MVAECTEVAGIGGGRADGEPREWRRSRLATKRPPTTREACPHRTDDRGKRDGGQRVDGKEVTEHMQVGPLPRV